ncbi:MAG: hypothetical protein ACR2IV_10610 [Bryobacteraceae bacterium]
MLRLRNHVRVDGRKNWRAILIGLLFAVTSLSASRTQPLPQGWRISPVGKHIQLMGDSTSRILVSPDGSHLMILTSGFHHQGVTVIDSRAEAIVSSANLGKVYGDMAFDFRSKQLFVCGGGAVDNAKLEKRLASRGEQIAALNLMLQCYGRTSMQGSSRSRHRSALAVWQRRIASSVG